MDLVFLSEVTFWIGLVASLLFITANYVVNRKTVIFLQTIAICMLIVQFGPLMGIWGVAALNTLFVIRNGFYSLKGFQNKAAIVSSVSIAAFVVAYFFIEVLPRLQSGESLELFLLFPILAAILNTAAFMQTGVIRFKIVFGASFLSWVMFDILKEQWGNLLGDAFSVIAAVISVSLIMFKNRQKANTADNI